MIQQNKKGETVARTSADFLAEQITQLKELFPEAFTEGKVDFDKLRATLGDLVDDGPERYTFTWAGKRDAIRLLQTPTRATLVPCREESVDFGTTQHLFIEGDNLEVLKLLYKPYFGRVKMIYIDPPYNTGNDFIYPDNYADPLATYLQLTGQQDAEGNLLTSNPETSGRYHSTWLSMMYPRLFLARQLLREDGVIFVSMDDNEVYSLRLLMNEAFGEENFVGTIVWKKKHAYGRGHTFIIPQTEYVICYAKDIKLTNEFGLPYSEDKVAEFCFEDEKGKYRLLRLWHTAPKGGYTRPTLQYELETPDGRPVDSVTGQWLWSKARMEAEIAQGNVVFIEQDDNTVRAFKKDHLVKGRTEKPTSFYDQATTDNATKEFNALLPEIEQSLFTKPTQLMKYLISSVGVASNDLVLDFFAGSSTTAQAVLELNREDGRNRRFIMVQLQEPTGNPQFPTIADIGKERIRRVIAKMNEGQPRETPEDLGFKVFKLAPSSYRLWRGVDEDTPDAYAQQMALFADPLVDGWRAENVIYEVALKEGYGLTCRIEPISPPLTSGEGLGVGAATIYRVTDLDKEQSFTICLDETIGLENFSALNLAKDDLFICRDVALDDEAAANLALQCRLKTI